MIYAYKVILQDGSSSEGRIDALSRDEAISTLQKRGYIIVDIQEYIEANILKRFRFGENVKYKDIVIFSRQIATLFESGVSALKAFRLLSSETSNEYFGRVLTKVADDIQSGSSISNAMAKNPDIFSDFYINMIRSGEESGKLNDAFLYLADYLDRSYELQQKTKKALTYPAFVVATFVIVMILMITFVIPQLAGLLQEEGQALPWATQIILSISNFSKTFGLILYPIMLLGLYYVYQYTKTRTGKQYFDQIKMKIPVVRSLYEKIFLSRFADNVDTLLSSGVSIVKALEITGKVVDNYVYEELLKNVTLKVQTGKSLSQALYEEPLIPNIMVQMTRIGEETGKLGYILKNLSNFYRREVNTAVDSLTSLLEPMLIAALGLGVGFLMAAVLMPMYGVLDSI